jgi:hypothetical protein
MPRSKTRSRAKQQATTLRDLFEHVLPPSPLHQAVQHAARQAGWSPPWELPDQTSNRQKAGKSSGVSRGGRMGLRRSLLMLARMQLSPEHRRTPYSNAAFGALRTQYDYLLSKGVDDPDPILSGILSALSATDRKWLKKASDDTLKKDLQAIRRMSGVKR